ncbi:MAG: D-alanyl-D-alanine carboxypeptidase, partial [Gammaproteobacteria bacterium]|nr:D-alanyl-D-alanine carboxypeptidase [Gammaproteobacteria bacterium]
QSGNDASVALAEHVSGTEEVFASLMNHYAAELGMTGTSFGNSTGLPHPETYSTARDQVLLGAALLREFPEIYGWFSDIEFTYNDITQQNRNRLLTLDSSVDGIKTGHTEAAGYCLASSAERNGMRLIAVVMGASSEEKRTDASRSLLNYGFRFYETHKLYDAEEKVAESRVWKGEDEMLSVGFSKPLYITIPRGYYEDLDASVSMDASIVAPVTRGEVRGEVTLSFKGKPLRSVPLTALHDVAPGGIVTRTLDSVWMWFE